MSKCKDCGQPMLPKGKVRRPNEYDHAQGCPESQPSPSGDELLWEFMEPFIGPTGGWLVSPKRFHAAIADWLRAHDAKVRSDAELLSEIIAILKLRLATHIKHITTDSGVQPNGYAAVLIPDWQVKQWIATFEAALKEPR